MMWLYSKGWGGFSLRKRYSRASDRRHAKTNYIIEKRCLGICHRRHAQIDYKINSLVGRGEEPKRTWKEWS
jgi:hypothetical protein